MHLDGVVEWIGMKRGIAEGWRDMSSSLGVAEVSPCGLGEFLILSDNKFV